VLSKKTRHTNGNNNVVTILSPRDIFVFPSDGADTEFGISQTDFTCAA